MYGEVIETQQLTPSLVRVLLGGDGLADYADTGFTDQYVNALFVPDGAPYAVPFELEAVKDVSPEYRPRGRRYTIRSWDPATRTLAIDFVVHGDIGYAGRWASNAQPGDLLQMVGPHGAYAPDPDADWHLMVGDESAIPAIAASLERVRPEATAVAVLVVDGPDCELELECPGKLDLQWVYRQYDADDTDRVVRAVAEVSFPSDNVDVFVHGEAHEIRAVRQHLIRSRGIARDGASISPYWRRGEDDEAWRQHKREFLAAMNADA